MVAGAVINAGAVGTAGFACPLHKIGFATFYRQFFTTLDGKIGVIGFFGAKLPCGDFVFPLLAIVKFSAIGGVVLQGLEWKQGKLMGGKQFVGVGLMGEDMGGSDFLFGVGLIQAKCTHGNSRAVIGKHDAHGVACKFVFGHGIGDFVVKIGARAVAHRVNHIGFVGAWGHFVLVNQAVITA